MSYVLKRPFTHVNGHCWRAEPPHELFPESDDVTDPSRSCLALQEEGRELGPPHTAHQLIESSGGGAFSHWAGEFRFSSSDNTDPNGNGRTYEVRWDADLYFSRRVSYALATIRSWAAYLPGGVSFFRGRDVLEIGPGRDMGTMLLIAALGARRVCGVDRFKGAWQDGWHDQFIAKLKAQAQSLGSELDTSVMDSALKLKQLDVAPVEFFADAFEEAGARMPNSFDVSVSHSTFEHFYSVAEASCALAAGMRPGGLGIHSVDFRDHANVGEPLKFLAIEDGVYADPAVNNHYGRGNRVRAPETMRMLRDAGFTAVNCHPSEIVQPEYLAGFLPQLRASPSSYAQTPTADLQVLSATLVIRK